MRKVIASLLCTLAAGCGGSGPPSPVDRVEIKLSSGWSAVEVELNSRGQGRYRRSEPVPRGRSGAFSVAPQRFEHFIARLEPFKRDAVALTPQKAQEMIDSNCPEGVPNVTDTGGVWIHWVGKDLDLHYSADFGCDYKRNAARNEELRKILDSLPVPLES